MVERSDDHDHDREAGEKIPEDDLTYRGKADHDQHALTLNAMQRFDVSVEELWFYYLSMGGSVNEYEVDAYLHGLIRLPAIDRDTISQSVNEIIDDIRRGPRAPYSASRNRGTSDAGLDSEIRAVLSSGVGNQNPTVVGNEFSGGEAAAKEQMLSVAYSSAATQPFGNADLAELLTESRSANHALHLTGLLLYREGRFLQVLEGPKATVRDRMALITADPRHTQVRLLVEETRDQRQFPDWAMGYEPISTTLSDDVPGYEKTFADANDNADLTDTIRVLHELIRWFQDHALPSR